MSPTHDLNKHSGTTMLDLPDGRKVHIRTAGPERERERASADTPAIVLLHGLGGNSFEWVAVIRELAEKGFSVFMADRAGYWPSSPPAKDVQPTLAWIAQDLKLVLETAKIEPPYVLVGQSYGGDIARQCMLDWPTELIAGMVVVDSPTKRVAPGNNNYQKLLGPDDYLDVVGLRANAVLTLEEDAARQEAEDKGEKIQGREMATAPADCDLQLSRIGSHQLLGDKPISVMYCGTANDFQKIYDHGVKHGYGSEENRQEMKDLLDVMADSDERHMRTMLGYSSCSRFVKTAGKAVTHNVHVVDPGCIVKEVEWVVAKLAADR